MPDFIDIHTHRNSNTDLCIRNIGFGEIIEANVPFSAGVHPWTLDDIDTEIAMEWVKSLAPEKNLYAVGETGLDKVIKVDFELQKQIFRQHVIFANSIQKPLIIHSVRSVNEVIDIINECQFNGSVIFHGFTGHVNLAKQLWDKGIYTSFGHMGFRSHKSVEMMKTAPLDRVFFETDDSGESIEDLYYRFSMLQNIDIDDLKIKIFENYQRVFKKVI